MARAGEVGWGGTFALGGKEQPRTRETKGRREGDKMQVAPSLPLLKSVEMKTGGVGKAKTELKN